jgi:hypothetical protein
MNLLRNRTPLARNVVEEFPRSAHLRRGLSFCEREAVFVVGNSLRSLYEDILKEDIPPNLKSIIEKLDRK